MSEGAPIDFAILTAIDVERQAVCAALGLGDDHRVKKGARVYWRGTVSLGTGEAYQVVVTHSLDQASIDAAVLTNDTLHHWKPGAALLVGIAASTDSKVKLGDVVVGSEIYYYERGKITPDGKRPEPRMMSPDATLWANVMAVRKWDRDVGLERPDGADEKPTLHHGVIASGEKVIADTLVRDEIASGHRKIVAIEMEGYGFIRAVWQSAEPVKALVVRGICDDASPSKGDGWHAYAAAAAARFVRHFLLDRPLEPRSRPDRP
jgi:nucleoside phosphorylase